MVMSLPWSQWVAVGPRQPDFAGTHQDVPGRKRRYVVAHPPSKSVSAATPSSKSPSWSVLPGTVSVEDPMLETMRLGAAPSLWARRPLSRLSICPQCKGSSPKGFGASSGSSSQPPKQKGRKREQNVSRKTKRVKSKGKQSMRMGVTRQEIQRQQQADELDPRQERFADPMERAKAQETGALQEDEDFQKRLQSFREESTLLAKEKRVNEAKAALEQNVLDQDIYAQPPTIAETLTRDSKTSTEPKAGPNRQLLAAGAIGLGIALLVSSLVVGGGPSSGPQTLQAPEMSAEDKTTLNMRINEFEARLGRDSKDTEALEGAAVSYAELGEFAKAEGLLEKLTALKPDDVEAWRVLGEARDVLGKPGKAVEAFQKAVALRPQDIGLLQSLCDALLESGKPQQAVEVVEAARPSTAVSSEAASPANQDYELDLLLAKVFSGWKGHSGDALSVYDRLIASSPDDFRAYLAKALLLKEEGRKGDAQRMFLQARFKAPPEAWALVDRLSGRKG